jgi:thiamine transport system permease protein
MSSLQTSNNLEKPFLFGGAFSLRQNIRLILGLFVALLVGLLIIGILLTIWRAADLFANQSASTTDYWHYLRMSAIQAGLSVVLSIVTGTILALCLNRLSFIGKPLLLAFLSVGMVLPTLILAFGLLAIWGRAGLINQTLLGLGAERLPFTIFGLHGILAAHTLLNGSFAARIFYDRLQGVPITSIKLARSLALSEFERIKIIEWPAIRSALPGLSATIFLVCFTSFSIVLLLGGGPNNATFEVAIYEAVRVDFDLERAALLAAAQLAFCLIIIVPTASLKSTSLMIGAKSTLSWPARGWGKWVCIALVAIMALLFASPIVATLIKGADPKIFALLASQKFLNAFFNSMAIATISATIATLLALALAFGRAELIYKQIEGTRARMLRTLISAPVFAYMATPAIVLGLGFFLLARLMQFNTGAIGLYVLILANALMALPIANATLGPPVEKIANRHKKLVRSLNLGPWQRVRAVELPLIRRELGYVFALGFCFSLGDLSVIALFGTGDFATLPWLMYLSLGSYRTNDAAMIASILLIITLLSFYLIPKLFAGRQDAQT